MLLRMAHYTIYKHPRYYLRQVNDMYERRFHATTSTPHAYVEEKICQWLPKLQDQLKQIMAVFVIVYYSILTCNV